MHKYKLYFPTAVIWKHKMSVTSQVPKYLPYMKMVGELLLRTINSTE